jgi:RecB family exonuclease
MASNLSFSYSKLGLYKECPQKYKFRYLLKIPEKPKYYFAFGTALHKVMEFLYSAAKPPFPPLEDALRFFKNHWESTTYSEKGYADAAKEKEGFLEGARIIKAYYEKHSADDFAPLATEFRSTVNIDGLSVISIVDRIDYLGNGFVSILDYKTGKTITREPDQLLMYQKLMDNNPQLLEVVQRRDPAAKEVRIAGMLFYYLPMMQEQRLEPASKEEIDAFWAGVLKVAADILAGKFEPAPSENKCRFCDYRAMCPVYKLSAADESWFSENAQEPTPSAIKDPLADLASKIDACGEAVTSAEKLKKEIAAMMSANGIVKHFGKNYAATAETIKTLDFKDRQKAVDFLKVNNLLGRVCAPTLGGIKALLESGALTPAQKKGLLALALEGSETKLNIVKTEE